MLCPCSREGYNGKSTLLALLTASLGDYVYPTDATLYYTTERPRGINEHAAGLLHFDKKRLALMEETSDAKQLANDMVSPQMRKYV